MENTVNVTCISKRCSLKKAILIISIKTYRYLTLLSEIGNSTVLSRINSQINFYVLLDFYPRQGNIHFRETYIIKERMLCSTS